MPAASSTSNGSCDVSSPTIFSRFGDESGSNSGSLSSNSFPEDWWLIQAKIHFSFNQCVLDFRCCMLLTFAGRNIFHRTVVIVWCCPLSWKRKINSRTGFKTSSFSSLFPFILVLFFFFDLESFFFFSCDAICINNGILLFDWCSLPKVDLKCHAPSDDTFLATNKRCDVWGGQGVKTKTNLATVTWGDGLILFKIVAKH